METAEAKREGKEGLSATERELVELRQQAHYWKSLHGRAVERERRLRQRLEELEAKVREYEKHLKESTDVIDALKAKVKQLAAMLFAPKSEKAPKEDPSDKTGDDTEHEGGGSRKRRRGKNPGDEGHGRRKREELPTEIVIHELTEDHCPGCGTPYIILPKTEDSEEIDVRIWLGRIIHRRVMAKPACSCGVVPGMITAPVPPKLIPKGLFTIGFWVYIILEKFFLQRPLSRVLKQLALHGLVDPRDDSKPGVSQGTLTGGLKRIWGLVQPLYQKILAETRAANHWHMDETRWLVFVEIEGKKGHRWWLWVVVTKVTVCYLLDPSRSSDVPRGLLEGAQGILNVDRYSAYKTLASEEEGIQLSFCWSHVRRDFDRVRKTREEPKLKDWAQVWIERIGNLYKLNEERLAVREDPEAFARRDQALREAVDHFKEQAERELSEGGLQEAQEKPLSSLLNHWAGLILFVDNPDVPMDNNEAERQLREAALGRKNYYGSGAEWSGRMAACLFSVLRTAQRNGLNPQHYLEVYFEACAENGGKPPEAIDSYLPWDLSDEVREAIEQKAHEQQARPPT
jgi:transposase